MSKKKDIYMENQKLDDEGEPEVKGQKTTDTHKFADKLSAVRWGLFLIWVGIALLMKLDVSIGLLGVGVITFAVQVARKYFNLKLEGFWVVVGLLFISSGLWELFRPNLPLIPILLIVAGSVLLVSVVCHLMRE